MFKSIFLPNLIKNKRGGKLTRQTDIHAHWLPGVDDGAKTAEEGIAMIQGLTALGFEALVATPHIMKDFYDNNSEKLEAAFRQFEKQVRETGIQTPLSLGAEYMLDDGFIQHLESGPLLTIRENMVLIEMSIFHPFAALKEFLFEIQLKGYQPVLAHPERYIYYYKNMKAFEEIKATGCLFQLNLLSLAGYYHAPTREIAKKLLRSGMYDMAGSDLHQEQQLKKLKKVSKTILH